MVQKGLVQKIMVQKMGGLEATTTAAAAAAAATTTTTTPTTCVVKTHPILSPASGEEAVANERTSSRPHPMAPGSGRRGSGANTATGQSAVEQLRSHASGGVFESVPCSK